MRSPREKLPTPEERAAVHARLDAFLATIKPREEWPALCCPRCGVKLYVYYGARSETWRAQHDVAGPLVEGARCPLWRCRWVGPKDRAEMWAGFADLVPVGALDPSPAPPKALRPEGSRGDAEVRR